MDVQILIDRGMSKDECKALCTSPDIILESKLFFRMIYELTFRPFEVQNLLIENWNRNTGEVTAQTTKTKYNPKKKETESAQPRSMVLTPNTNEMLKKYVSQRKKGYIFESRVNKGEPITLRHFEKEINKYAKLLSIQKDKSKTPTGRVYRLISLMALREAGERHHDQAGGDEAISAKAAGHTMGVKHKYYKKGSFNEAQESYKQHHPAFTEGW